MDDERAVGAGPGFDGDELLSKDELNIILDYEDERNRLGQFDQIFPLPSTAAAYYGFMEVKRYQNALMCAWLSTPQAIRRKLINNCQIKYGQSNKKPQAKETKK